MPGTDIHTG